MAPTTLASNAATLKFNSDLATVSNLMRSEYDNGFFKVDDIRRLGELYGYSVVSTALKNRIASAVADITIAEVLSTANATSPVANMTSTPTGISATDLFERVFLYLVYKKVLDRTQTPPSWWSWASNAPYAVALVATGMDLFKELLSGLVFPVALPDVGGDWLQEIINYRLGAASFKVFDVKYNNTVAVNTATYGKLVASEGTYSRTTDSFYKAATTGFGLTSLNDIIDVIKSRGSSPSPNLTFNDFTSLNVDQAVEYVTGLSGVASNVAGAAPDYSVITIPQIELVMSLVKNTVSVLPVLTEITSVGAGLNANAANLIQKHKIFMSTSSVIKAALRQLSYDDVLTYIPTTQAEGLPQYLYRPNPTRPGEVHTYSDAVKQVEFFASTFNLSVSEVADLFSGANGVPPNFGTVKALLAGTNNKNVVGYKVIAGTTFPYVNAAADAAAAAAVTAANAGNTAAQVAAAATAVGDAAVTAAVAAAAAAPGASGASVAAAAVAAASKAATSDYTPTNVLGAWKHYKNESTIDFSKLTTANAIAQYLSDSFTNSLVDNTATVKTDSVTPAGLNSADKRWDAYLAACKNADLTKRPTLDVDVIYEALKILARRKRIAQASSLSVSSCIKTWLVDPTLTVDRNDVPVGETADAFWGTQASYAADSDDNSRFFLALYILDPSATATAAAAAAAAAQVNGTTAAAVAAAATAVGDAAVTAAVTAAAAVTTPAPATAASVAAAAAAAAALAAVEKFSLLDDPKNVKYFQKIYKLAVDTNKSQQFMYGLKQGINGTINGTLGAKGYPIPNWGANDKILAAINTLGTVSSELKLTFSILGVNAGGITNYDELVKVIAANGTTISDIANMPKIPVAKNNTSLIVPAKKYFTDKSDGAALAAPTSPLDLVLTAALIDLAIDVAYEVPSAGGLATIVAPGVANGNFNDDVTDANRAVLNSNQAQRINAVLSKTSEDRYKKFLEEYVPLGVYYETYHRYVFSGLIRHRYFSLIGKYGPGKYWRHAIVDAVKTVFPRSHTLDLATEKNSNGAELPYFTLSRSNWAKQVSNLIKHQVYEKIPFTDSKMKTEEKELLSHYVEGIMSADDTIGGAGSVKSYESNLLRSVVPVLSVASKEGDMYKVSKNEYDLLIEAGMHADDILNSMVAKQSINKRLFGEISFYSLVARDENGEPVFE
jgi:hypothetical protein